MTRPIERIPFGSTGHHSSRVLFGAAALYSMKQDRADRLLDALLEYGVNHIDTAAAYGESELRIAPWMKRHRGDFFLATKTGARTKREARESIHRSLERLGVTQLDLIQLHNLVDAGEWQTALGPDGALEACVDARAEGLVRFIGVTGHGYTVAERHLASLERFAFDSVLAPYNATMMKLGKYAADFERLAAVCRERGVALQTIKSIARRRWEDPTAPHYSWYEPLTEADAIRRGVHFALARPGFFLNSSSDGRLLRTILEAASEPRIREPDAAELDADISRYDMQPLFVEGRDDI